MSRVEVLRWLHALRTDPWYREFNPVLRRGFDDAAGLAEASGLSVRTLMYAMRNKSGANGEERKKIDRGISERTCAMLAPVIAAVENGRLKFVGGLPVWRIEPAPRPAPLPKLVLREDWRDWTLCRSCGGNRWAPVAIFAREHAACWFCIPPDQWPALGAVKSEHQLVAVEVD